MINKRALRGMRAGWRGRAAGHASSCTSPRQLQAFGVPRGDPITDASQKSHCRARCFLPAGNEQSWCKRETCLCDKAVASCFSSALHSYNKSYHFYFRLKCRGSKLQC